MAGRPPDDALEDDKPVPCTSAPAADKSVVRYFASLVQCHCSQSREWSSFASCRGQKQAKQVLVSDSDSDGDSDKAADAASDFSTSEESQQSDSSTSSLDDSDEESPPPAKKGRKVLCHPSYFDVSTLTNHAHCNHILSCRTNITILMTLLYCMEQQQSARPSLLCCCQAVAVTARADTQKAKPAAPGQKATKRATASKAAETKRASTAVSASKQQSEQGPAKTSAQPLHEAEEILPMKPRAVSGNMMQPCSHKPLCASGCLLCSTGGAAAALAQPAATLEVRHAQQSATDNSKALQDNQEPSADEAALKIPADTIKAKTAISKSQALPRSASILPRHMSKGIQINSPGPAYRAPGLKRPQGGKPLHQIQPVTK